MRATPVNDRDTKWEQDHPIFRVYFWNHHLAPSGNIDAAKTPTLSSYEILDARDVCEVVDWAEQNSGAEWAEANPGRSRTYVLYVLMTDDARPGLIRLSGINPVAAPD